MKYAAIFENWHILVIVAVVSLPIYWLLGRFFLTTGGIFWITCACGTSPSGYRHCVANSMRICGRRSNYSCFLEYALAGRLYWQTCLYDESRE